jgi:catechol 2,3-dioxygenase-like lactoylglutathione lyase family enzyme
MAVSSKSIESAVSAVDGISYLAVPVSDLARATDFYCRILGLAHVGTDVLPHCGAHTLLRAPSGQLLALAVVSGGPDLRDTGVHQAYRITRSQRATIHERLVAEGLPVLTYKEDRPAEEGDNFYFLDPEGNRLQLIIADRASSGDGISGIDHAAVQVPDMEWAEEFYKNELGLAVDHRVGWRTADHSRARRWAAGEEDMAPGTRRMDQLYMTMGGERTTPRANMQLFFLAGDAVLGVFLATQHFQEPPEEQLAGTPRIAITASRTTLDSVAGVLQAKGRPFTGPVEHPVSVPLECSLFFKDTGGNFLELCVPRKA